MSKPFDIGLNAKINNFAEKFKIKRSVTNDDKVFEHFSNYVISSILLERELENITAVCTNEAQGIDGIVMIINNNLISEESDLDKLGPLEEINLRMGFIQSTIQSSFDNQKLSAFSDEVIKFLTGENRIEPFYTIYKQLLDEDGQYINRMSETPTVSLYFLSAKTNNQNITEQQIDCEKQKFNNRVDISNKCILSNFCVYQTEDIKREFDKISKFHTIQMKLDTNVQFDFNNDKIEISLLTSIKFSELKKLILTKDNELKGHLFVENVRNYIGETPVNLDIKKTLDNVTDRKFFPYLNNGLTILCNRITKAPVADKTFNLIFPRIINGCQTTNTLYRKFKSLANPNELDDVEVIAKIISTEDNELKKAIIYAANNQNAIDKDLQSMNDFHKKIEEFFIGQNIVPLKLYFERLRGQYHSVIPTYSRINIENLARVYISVFLKEPEKMKTNALTKIDEYCKLKKIFCGNPDDNKVISDYFYCAMLYYWFNHFYINKTIVLKSKTMDMHLLMAVNLYLDKINKTSIDEKIQYLSMEENAKNIFVNTCEFLNRQTFLFERRGFYSAPKKRQLIQLYTNSDNIDTSEV